MPAKSSPALRRPSRRGRSRLKHHTRTMFAATAIGATAAAAARGAASGLAPVGGHRAGRGRRGFRGYSARAGVGDEPSGSRRPQHTPSRSTGSRARTAPLRAPDTTSFSGTATMSSRSRAAAENARKRREGEPAQARAPRAAGPRPRSPAVRGDSKRRAIACGPQYQREPKGDGDPPRRGRAPTWRRPAPRAGAHQPANTPDDGPVGVASSRHRPCARSA